VAPEASPKPLRATITAAAAVLARAGVPSPDTDAELLAAHVLGTSRGGLLAADPFGPAAAARFAALVDARAARVPLQHLTGRAPFRHLELQVGPGVFTPRPETEVLVQWGLDVLAAEGLCAPVVVDLCAGSGAIALAVAYERPDAAVYAVERSRNALAWARRNAQARIDAGDPPVRFVQGDVTDPAVLCHLDSTVDLVLTNPPYVPDGAVLPPEVADHDPPEALWGGPDGLDVVRGLLGRAAALLRPGGWLGIEHADVQGTAVPNLVRRAGGWSEVSDRTDLAGRHRVTTARRLAPPTTAR